MALKDLAFGLSLKSSGFDKGMASVRKELQNLAKSRLAGLKKELADVGKSNTALSKTKFKGLLSEFRGIQTAMKQTAAEAKKTHAAVRGMGMVKGAFSVAGGIGLANAGGGIFNAIKDFFSGSIEKNSELERATATFEVLFKSADKAKEVLRLVRAEADKSPFKTGDMIEAAKALAPMVKGDSALLMRTMKTAEVMAAFNPAMGIKGAVEALKDAATGENERLKEFGIGSAAIKGAGGKATSIAGAAALVDKVYKGMGIGSSLIDKLAGTWEGMMSTLQSFIAEVQRIVGESLFYALKTKLQSTLQWINANREAIFARAKEIGEGIENAAMKAWTAVESLIRFLSSGGSMWTVVKDIIGNIFKDALAWGELLGNKVIDNAKPFAVWFIDQFGRMITSLLNPMTNWTRSSALAAAPTSYKIKTAEQIADESSKRWGATVASWAGPQQQQSAPQMATGLTADQNAIWETARMQVATVSAHENAVNAQLLKERSMPMRLTVTSIGARVHPVALS